jgi:hypothetical protein
LSGKLLGAHVACRINHILGQSNEPIWSGTFCTRKVHVWTRVNFTSALSYSRLGSRARGRSSRYFFLVCIWSTSHKFLCSLRLRWHLSRASKTRDSWRILSILWLCMWR